MKMWVVYGICSLALQVMAMVALSYGADERMIVYLIMAAIAAILMTREEN